MEFEITDSEESGSQAPAVSLEISAEIAEKAEQLLGDFAEDAGLETALIVDRGGALVAGISSEEDVTVDVISGLVAGASSAMRALVDQLGETGEIESLHQGGKRLLYIREIVSRFILVGVSDASFPPGVLREKASQLQPGLADLLRDVKPLDPPEEAEPTERPKSLRAVAAERAAARVKEQLEKAGPTPEELAEEENPESPERENTFEGETNSEDENQGDDANNEEEIIPDAAAEEAVEDLPPPEPVTVMEPIDMGEPEIVIERTSIESIAEESPFEIEIEDESAEQEDEAEESEATPAESIFEWEEESEDPVPKAETSVFEWVEDEEESGESTPLLEEDGETTETVFEFDETADDEGAKEDGEIFDSSREESEEPEEPEEPEDEETESRSSGPMYF